MGVSGTLCWPASPSPPSGINGPIWCVAAAMCWRLPCH